MFLRHLLLGFFQLLIKENFNTFILTFDLILEGYNPLFFMSVISKKNLKNIFFIIWYIIYLQQGYFLYWNQGWLNNAVAGVLMAIYPLSIFHLESLRTTGDVLSFKGEFYDQLSKPQKFFLIIAELASIAVFGLFTFMSIFSLLFSSFK